MKFFLPQRAKFKNVMKQEETNNPLFEGFGCHYSLKLPEFGGMDANFPSPREDLGSLLHSTLNEFLTFLEGREAVIPI
ncbi:unnamed protein product [Linum trigynum]|uniref:PD-(D/E)XK endonuclease-like domain-containing protein n=1 Tax=Linum trigynum TaxID=586398 RepID=A0AAV2GQC0_9ROSI